MKKTLTHVALHKNINPGDTVKIIDREHETLVRILDVNRRTLTYRNLWFWEWGVFYLRSLVARARGLWLNWEIRMGWRRWRNDV